MKRQTQEEIFDETVAQMRTIIFSKNEDYANEDTLSNFKLAGAIIGLTPEMNCLNHIATKLARLGVLLNTTNEPNNESIDDSLNDLANYAILLKMIRRDK